MRRALAALLACTVLMASTGCGDSLHINGSLHDTVGMFTTDQKDPEVCYRVIVGNVVWSVLLVHTIVAPTYFIGFSLWEPTERTDCYRPT